MPMVVWPGNLNVFWLTCRAVRGWAPRSIAEKRTCEREANSRRPSSQIPVERQSRVIPAVQLLRTTAKPQLVDEFGIDENQCAAEVRERGG
jgi:hypothetical protein